MLQMPPILIPPVDPSRDARLAAAVLDQRDTGVVLLFLGISGVVLLIGLIRATLRLRQIID